METAELLNPAADLPLIGSLLAALDKAATGMGLPFWARAFIGCAVVAVLAYLLLWFLARKLVPRLASAMVGPVSMFVNVIRVVFLLPDLAVAKAIRKANRTPPEFQYAYGTALMAVADATDELSRRLLPTLAAFRSAPKWVFIVAVAVVFVLWNGNECVPGASDVCVSPVDYWTNSLEAEM